MICIQVRWLDFSYKVCKHFRFTQSFWYYCISDTLVSKSCWNLKTNLPLVYILINFESDWDCTSSVNICSWCKVLHCQTFLSYKLCNSYLRFKSVFECIHCRMSQVWELPSNTSYISSFLVGNSCNLFQIRQFKCHTSCIDLPSPNFHMAAFKL